MVKLKRLEVEGGFLNGVDLQFAEGLNVLIGARGSGRQDVGDWALAVLPRCPRRYEACPAGG